MTPVPVLGKREILERFVEDAEAVEPGLRILASDLEVGEGAAVDHLACDGTGRPVVVLAAPEEGDALFLRVLDALGWVRDARALLERYRPKGLDPGAPPRALLVLPPCGERFRRRLESVGGVDVDLVRVEAWREGGERRVAFVKETVAGARSSRPPAEPPLRGLWDEALAKLGALDEEVRLGTGGGDVHARFAGRLLAAVGAREGALRVVVPEEASAEVRDRASLHGILDAAVRRLLTLAGPAAPPAAPAGLLTEEEVGELTR